MFSTLNIYLPPSYKTVCREKQFLTKISGFSFKYIIAEKTMSAFIFLSLVDKQKIAIYLSPSFNFFLISSQCWDIVQLLVAPLPPSGQLNPNFIIISVCSHITRNANCLTKSRSSLICYPDFNRQILNHSENAMSHHTMPIVEFLHNNYCF